MLRLCYGILILFIFRGFEAVPMDSFKQYATEVGGNVESDSQYPYHALIINKFFMPLCGGVIIKKDTVLTSASCAYDIDLDQHRIFVGSYKMPQSSSDITEHGTFYDISNVHIIDGASPPKRDLALIKIQTEFPAESDYIKPVIFSPEWPITSYKSCTLISWWLQKKGAEKQTPFSTNLLYHHLEIYYPDGIKRCADISNAYDLYCTGDSTVQDAGPVSDKNDKGSPVVCDNQLVGIIPKSSANGYVINTTLYYDWIKYEKIVTTATGSTGSTQQISESTSSPDAFSESGDSTQYSTIVIITIIVVILLLPAIIIPVKIIKNKYR